MATIHACPLPETALLHKYRAQGAYTDCYVTGIDRAVSRSEYVEAFYTTAVFKAERQVLRWMASTPSTDAQARQFAAGTLGSFAAWTVEDQGAEQVLLRDMSGRTRSWLMAVPVDDGGRSCSTRLYFGSAVLPVVHARSGRSTLGLAFWSLIGFHKLYSRILLDATRTRLLHRQGALAPPSG